MGKRAKRDILSDGPPSRADEMRLVAAEALAAALEAMGRKGRGPASRTATTGGRTSSGTSAAT
jgi:hypothetical protein